MGQPAASQRRVTARTFTRTASFPALSTSRCPKGSGAICFEDPRLPLMMAAPPRARRAEDLRTLVTVEPRPGLLLLWESWLRHEVLAGSGKGERLSISFNFA